MPVRKLRSLQEAEDSVWLDRADPRLWSTIAGVWELADRLFPRRFPPGVYRNRSIDEANRRGDPGGLSVAGSLTRSRNKTTEGTNRGSPTWTGTSLGPCGLLLQGFTLAGSALGGA